MTEKIAPPLPQNLEAERALIAAGLLDNGKIADIAISVSPDDFFSRQNRVLYLATTAMAGNGVPVDLVTLVDYLTQTKELEAAGGVAYVAGITDGHSKVSNFKQYAKIVHGTAIRRKMIHLCAAMTQSAFEGEESSQKLLEIGAQEYLSLMSQDGSASLPSTWEESAISAMDRVVDGIKNPDHTLRLNSGVEPFDKALGGLRRELVLGVGMTSHGKSLMAMQFAIDGDNNGKKGLILSAEMTKEDLVTRELSHASGVPLFLLRRPEIIRSKERVLQDLTEAVVKERNRKLLIVDRDITPSRVWSLCELVHKRSGLDFVVVDYDQLVIRARLGKRDDEFRAQAEFMADALAIQKRLNICFMLLCQPRKVDEDVARGRRPPRIEQIFGSSSAGNTAHVVWWIMREFFTHGYDEAYKSKAKAYILKARNDSAGSVDFGFDSERVLFVSQPPDWDPVAEAEAKESRIAKKKKAKEAREN